MLSSSMKRKQKHSEPLNAGIEHESPTKTHKLVNSPEMNPQSSPEMNPKDDSTPNEELSDIATKRRKLTSDSLLTESPEETLKERSYANLLSSAIENMNLARSAIVPLKFDLESIYTKKSFDFAWPSSPTDTAMNYDVNRVKLPKDKNGNLLSKALIDVFSEPMNCGYFNEDELDRIFGIMKLSPEAQSLLARMLKRKRDWHKIDAIKYPEIADDLGPIFGELVKRKILDDDTRNVSMEKLLSLLHVEEVRNVCKAMKVNCKGTKPALIGELVKLSSRKKSLFPGMKSPSSALEEKIRASLGACVRVPKDSEELLDRLLILLVPNQDPRESMTEAFRTLAEVEYGDKIFPPTPGERKFPIFRDRNHLRDYAEARSALTRIYNASEAKDWDTARAVGRSALERLRPVFRKNEVREASKSSTLPSHVKRFESIYNWAKVLWISVEGFKKTKDGVDTAAEILYSLVKRSDEYLGHPVRWYRELALIEMHHRKNLEASAEITLEALKREKLSANDAAELAERARKLLGRSKNISEETKKRLVEATSRLGEEKTLSSMTKPLENIIEATVVQGNKTGSKSTWSVGIGGADVGYLTVEQLALLHYSGKGFSGCLHCEGSLPVTLFATLFWNEIYGIAVPGAFVSSYQEAPLDLYSSHFIDNRREQLENKLSLVRNNLRLEELSAMMRDDFIEYRNYVSLIHGKLFQDPEDFKNFVECLGTAGLAGICERLANNYIEWRSGFPDLAVWDPVNKKCKFVEVKGPGDSLSIKQKLWIQYLESLDLGVEVCVVKGTTRKYAI